MASLVGATPTAMAASDGDRMVELLLWRPYLLAPRITVDEDILVEEVDDDDEGGVVKESEWTDIMATC